MLISTLDDQLRRQYIISKYESCIWTERWNAVGSVELKVMATQGNRDLLQDGVRLSIPQSSRVMEIQTATAEYDEDGRYILTAVGRSLEHLLEQRIGRKSFAGLNTEPKWLINGNPKNIAEYIFNYIAVLGTLDPNDKLPFYKPGNIYPADTMPYNTANVFMEFEPDSIFNQIKEVCDTYGMGFRITKDKDKSVLYFNIYSGNDRSSGQDRFPAVIFSPQLDNMDKISELHSSEPYKNVAYVFAQNGSRKVYSGDADSSTAGFNRRVMYVSASDITTAAGTELQNQLEQRGRQELAKNRRLAALDGELSATNPYKYEIDYYLGDMCDMHNNEGVTNRMRVTEQIFSSDSAGEKSYPTLTADQFIAPGTWYAWDPNMTWDAATQTWQEALIT